jgi:RNA polymerase sigma-70 factor (ECF subfamily)
MLFDRWLEDRDGDAFAELARRHSPVVFDLTCRVLGDRAGAEDVLQEALLSLALERTRRPVEVGVVAWLARFAICRARNRRVSERCRTRRQIVVGLERPEEAMPDDSVELKEELEHALAGCDPEDRALLAMRFLHGWDYDRIASALSIREGAARVRVHRALEAVRAKAGAKDARGVTPVLAALPVAALPAARLDATIRAAVGLAQVRLGAPPNGVEHATAASRSFRVAVTMSGAVLLFVGAAGVSAVDDVAATAGPGASDGLELASAAVAGPDRASSSFVAGAVPAPVDDGFRGVPRPLDWDLGVLRRAATGAGDDAAVRPAAPAPREAAPAPEAPARAAVPDPEQAPAAFDDSPGALRPIQRGACAANGDSGSSDDERAGALGGSSGVAAEPPSAAAAESPEPQHDLVPRASSGSRVVVVETLPDDTRALLGEAEQVVREFLASHDVAVEAADPATVRRAARVLRRQFGAARDAAAGGRPRTVTARAKRQRAAILRQVFQLLTQVVLSDGRQASDLRWPSGADLGAALQEVIRVLGTGTASTDPAAVRTLPSGASDASRGVPSGAAALPSGAAE